MTWWGGTLEMVPTSVRFDRAFLVGVLKRGVGLKDVPGLPADMLKDKAFLVEVARASEWGQPLREIDVPPDLVADAASVAVMAKAGAPVTSLQRMPPPLRKDGNLALEVVRTRPDAVQAFDVDKAMALRLIQDGEPRVFQALPPALRDDREVEMAAVRKRGWLLTQKGTADKELALLAIKQDPGVFHRVAPELKDDVEVLVALARSIHAQSGAPRVDDDDDRYRPWEAFPDAKRGSHPAMIAVLTAWAADPGDCSILPLVDRELLTDGAFLKALKKANPHCKVKGRGRK